MTDLIVFVILPYTAVVLAVVVSIIRYRRGGFTYTSLSSQLLESDELFYGSVAWHYGILVVLTGHLLGFLFPARLLWFNSVPIRLYLLEATGLLFGLMALLGVVSFLWRRLASPRLRAVTSAMDWTVLLLLLFQVVLGVGTAVFYRWGSSWYAVSAVPYLRSLLLFQPDTTLIAPLPLTIKLHILGAWLLVAVFPFSRLVHAVVVPVHYLWRTYQLVIWNHRPAERQQPSSPDRAVQPVQSTGGRVPIESPSRGTAMTR